LAYQPGGNLYITIEPAPIDIKNQNPMPLRTGFSNFGFSQRQTAEERIKRSAVPVIPEVHSQFEGTTFTHEYVIPKNGYHIAEYENEDPTPTASHKYGEIEREPILPLPHKGSSPEKQHYQSIHSEEVPADPEIHQVVAQIIAEQKEYELRSSQVESQTLKESLKAPYQIGDSFHYAYDNHASPPTQSSQIEVPKLKEAPYQIADSFHYTSTDNRAPTPTQQRDIYFPKTETLDSYRSDWSKREEQPIFGGERLKRSAFTSANKKYNKPEDLPSYRSATNDITVTSYNIGQDNYLSNRNYTPVHEGRSTAPVDRDFGFLNKEPENIGSFRSGAHTTGYQIYDSNWKQQDLKLSHHSQDTKTPRMGTIVYESYSAKPQYHFSYNVVHEPGHLQNLEPRGGLLAEVSSASSKYTPTTVGHPRFGEESTDLRKFLK